MKHHLFGSAQPEYSIAVLVKTTSFLPSDLKYYFVDELVKQGMKAEDIIAFDLEYTLLNKAPVKLIKAYLEGLLKALESLKVTTLLCADPNYFKTLTGVRKTTGCIGYIYPCKIEGYEHMSVILSPNPGSLFHDPTNQTNITYAVNTVANHVKGQHVNFGTNIIHNGHYPKTDIEIENWLNHLHTRSVLTCDIETFSLAIDKAGIGTIAFAWNEHEGIAFACDYTTFPCTDDGVALYGYKNFNIQIRKLLKQFFESYTGKLIYHGSTFDIKMLVYNLWMEDSLDQAGLIEGLQVMTRLFEDTKVITFLATNSTAGNSLGLKENAHEFAGNYAQEDIEDIRLIPLDDLLEYNLVDCLSTWYVYNKNTPIMIQANQQDIYENIMLKSVKVILQMELVGLPLNMDNVMFANSKLITFAANILSQIQNSPIIVKFEKLLLQELQVTDLLLRRSKAKHPNKLKAKELVDLSVKFNPNSNTHLQNLIYDKMGFPVTDKTKSGAPSTKGKVIQKILNQLIYAHKITKEELNE